MMTSRRTEREHRARDTIYRVIPEIFRSSPRAKYGISQADLIEEPKPWSRPTSSTPNLTRSGPQIRVQCIDTLQAAARLSARPYSPKRSLRPQSSAEEVSSNVTILNMASLARPGGGFLAGGNSQEEFLCARSTLYASLYEEYYPLPDLGGIYTPDVLVFRDSSIDAIDLPKRDRFFVNVISAGVERHPDNRGRTDERLSNCSCGVSYCDRDRDLMIQKMKSVMRIAQMHRTEHLILGAWGCGAMNHPVKEVAKLWRKIIAGSPRQRRPNHEQWEGIQEIVFAVPNAEQAREFRKAFDDVLAPDAPQDRSSSGVSSTSSLADDAEMSKLIATVTSLELQIELAQSSFLKNRLREELASLNRELAQGRVAKASRDDFVEDDDVEDDYVVGGFQASDCEDNNFYRVDNTSDSESDASKSETYEFRFKNDQPRYDPQGSPDDDDEAGPWPAHPPSPQFDSKTGWFQGSIDQLSAHLYASGHMKPGSVSPRSPLVRPDSSTTNDENAVNSFLSHFPAQLEAVEHR